MYQLYQTTLNVNNDPNTIMKFLTDILENDLQRQTRRSHVVSVTQQILIAIRFYSNKIIFSLLNSYTYTCIHKERAVAITVVCTANCVSTVYCAPFRKYNMHNLNNEQIYQLIM